jgi:hypothetical protein
MSDWFKDKYILRAEHQHIVAYYKKLVVQLHGKARELQAQLESMTGGKSDAARPHGARPEPEHEVEQTEHHGDNVIRVDFRQRLSARSRY